MPVFDTQLPSSIQASRGLIAMLEAPSAFVMVDEGRHLQGCARIRATFRLGADV
jgi:hypothetical protein